MTQFLTYSKFYIKEESEELTSFLSKHNIDFKIEQEKNLLDKIYIEPSYDPMIILKIKDIDFHKVNHLIENEFEIDLSTIDKNYYLLSFSNDELLSMFSSPDA